MARRPETTIKQARARIARIREALSEIDYLCSGTLLKRTKMCGRPGCACAQDPNARHGPYFEWGHMKGGKLVVMQPPRDRMPAVGIDAHTGLYPPEP
jgi:hypothetical protein